MKEQLIAQIKTALKNLGIEAENIVLEHPADLKMGDYSTNVAMAYAKQMGKNPKALAEEIVSAFPCPDKGEAGEGLISKIEIAGPGFINFYLSGEFFTKEFLKIKKEGKEYGKSTIHAGEKILIEHSSPNLFKPFHVGHMMNNAIGESISRLAKSSGAEVEVISYPSDISLGIGKAVYSALSDGLEKLQSFTSDKDKLAYLGNCYVRGTKAYDESDEVKARVREITKNLYEKIPSPELSVYEEGKIINLEYFKNIVARLGSHFDAFIYESEAGLKGKEIVEAHVGDVFTKSDGAIIYEGEKDGLHTRVFINSEGYPTYEAKDVGLMSLKFERYNPDISITITDHEQSSYFQVVESAIAKINQTWADKMVHRTHGRMSFKGQKMSSRLGGVPLASDILEVLIGETAEYAKDGINANGENAEAIAVAAIKFAILRARAGSNIDFNPETSLSFEGDSGPYLQYTTVRAKSVLKKAKEQGFEMNLDEAKEWNDLSRFTAKFPLWVERSITEWAPHHITMYALELAHLFNSWYGNTQIISENKKETEHNLFITYSVAQVLENAINLLGMEVPEKM